MLARYIKKGGAVVGPGGDPLHLQLKQVASSTVVARIVAAERSKQKMKN
jgi:hypothetical protein